MADIKKAGRKKWLRWLNVILVIYLLTGIAVYFFQDAIFLRPQTLPANTKYAFPMPHREIDVKLDKAYSMNVVQFLTDHDPVKGVVLYFHGNMKNIGRYAEYAGLFTGNGYEVWMVDYPGFGKSTGRLTEQKMYEYAEQLYLMAASRFKANNIVIYGKSLGTGVAAWLAAKKSSKQLILETPYYSFHSLAAHYMPMYPVSKLIRLELPVYKYISIVNAPVAVFHGTEDDVIPYSNAEKLKESLKPADHFFTIENGAHNNLAGFPVFRQKLDSLLAD
ncbi:MAG: alpha/beta fold hydrolase [Chitinophagaceae bacterium]|nr:alpha/beta fold hydrolase [Chitinophagaceae bacterium]